MRLALIVAVLVSSAGCVAQSAHDALQSDHARTVLMMWPCTSVNRR